MLVQQVQQALTVEQHLHQPLGLHLPHFFFSPSFRHAVLNDCISGERYCMWAPGERWRGLVSECLGAPDVYLEILWILITGTPASITTCLLKSK